MAKKLKVELDVETSKAKAKIRRDMGGAVDAGVPGGSGAKDASSAAASLERSLDRAARSAQNFGRETERGGASMTNALRAFAGFGTGMAMSYAAHFMPEGVGRNRVEKAAETVKGASLGAAAGEALVNTIPGGAMAKFLIKAGTTAAGGAIGYASKDAEQEKARADQLSAISDQSDNYEAAKEWRDKLREITEMPAQFGKAQGVDLLKAQLGAVEERSRKAGEELERLAEQEQRLRSEAESAARDSKLEESGKKMQELAQTQAKSMQVEAARHSADRQADALRNQIANYQGAPAFRASITAIDSLSRIGGNAIGGGATRSVETAEAGPSGGHGHAVSISAAALGAAVSSIIPKLRTTTTSFLQDRGDAMLSELSLNAEKETNKLLSEINNTLKAQGGVSWQ